MTKLKRRWVLVGLALLVGLATFGLVCAPYFVGPQHRAYDKLIAAIDRSDASTVRELLEDGQDPNWWPQDFWANATGPHLSPLSIAADEGNTEVVRLLLDYGADPNLGDAWNANPLSAAVYGDHLEVMELLIERGALVNDGKDWSSALWRAAMDGRVQAVRFLLEHGANPNMVLHVHGDEPRTLLECQQETSPNAQVTELLKEAVAKHGSEP